MGVCVSRLAKKNERPVGVPTALAWGWRVLIRGSVRLGILSRRRPLPLRSQAAEWHTGARSLRSFTRLESRTEPPISFLILPAGSYCVTRPSGSIAPVLRRGTLGYWPSVPQKACYSNSRAKLLPQATCTGHWNAKTGVLGAFLREKRCFGVKTRFKPSKRVRYTAVQEYDML
jgi:hypothetical protein